jgi:hypothetical protein
MMGAMKAPGLTSLAACIVLGAAAMGLWHPWGTAASTREAPTAPGADPGSGRVEDPAGDFAASGSESPAALPPGHPPIEGMASALPPGHPPIDDLGAGLPVGHPPIDDLRAGLPPDHPPVGGAASPVETPANAAATSDEAPSISWTVPTGWKTLPNPTAMRIATYGPTADSELLVVRAGGSTDANFDRWVGQFEEPARSRRYEKTVRGLEVEILEVSGTYTSSGMVPGSSSVPHTGWTLLGAAVETPGSHYFFKLVGPSDQVQSAHRSFDGLIESIRPMGSPPGIAAGLRQ